MAGWHREATWLPSPGLPVPEHPQVRTLPVSHLSWAPGHSLGLVPGSLFQE
jgi:hypothetical protein